MTNPSLCDIEKLAMKINFYEIFFSVVTYAWKSNERSRARLKTESETEEHLSRPSRVLDPDAVPVLRKSDFEKKKTRRLLCSLRIKQNKASGIYTLFSFEAMDKGAWTERLIYYLFSALLGLGKGL